MNIKTKLCIFDLDGTLLDTIDDIANSMNRILAANNFPTHNIAWYKKVVGYGAKALILDALPTDHGFSETQLDDLVLKYKEDYMLHSKDLTKPYDGVRELLLCLAGDSIKIAVVTNKSQKNTELVLEEFFGDVDFVAIYGEAPGKPYKPDPTAAYEILSLTGASPDETVVIGDAETDMLFAERASIFSIGVLWGFRNREILEKHGAKAIVEKPEQILEYINY